MLHRFEASRFLRSREILVAGRRSPVAGTAFAAAFSDGRKAFLAC